MAATTIDQARYASALSALDVKTRSLLDNYVPIHVAHCFAAARDIKLCADFHRDVRYPEDSQLYAADASPKISLTFVNDVHTDCAYLNTQTLVCSYHDKTSGFEGGQLRTFSGNPTTSNFCRMRFDDFGRGRYVQGRRVVLLSIDGIEKDVVRTVKDKGGIVILVQDRDGWLSQSFDPDTYDMSLPYDELPRFAQVLRDLRKAYQTTTPINQGLA